MKVLNISSNDEIGGRFNGFDIHEPLARRGVETSLGCFWNHHSLEKWTFNLFPGKHRRLLAETVRAVEIMTGFQNTFQWWSKSLFQTKEFKEADVIHLQIVHDHFLRFEVIEEICEKKPTVWTWHDLWPITGHCIQPGSCSRWEAGCGSCPDLAAPQHVLRDRTRNEYKRKLSLIEAWRPEIHITTEWMERQILNHLPVGSCTLHRFPFGVDLNCFNPRAESGLRPRLGIKDSSFVVFARATDQPGKNFREVVRSLEKLSHKYDVVLLTVQDQQISEANSSNLRIVQFPWISDPTQLAKLYAICDVFVMPSFAESFGMMALEAMASGKPVVHVADTATAEVVGDPLLAVETNDLEKNLTEIFTTLITEEDFLVSAGARARNRVEANYSLDDYLSRLIALYKFVKRKRS
jgi:glycosyltransferase involved in cell wall biosynthesis